VRGAITLTLEAQYATAVRRATVSLVGGASFTPRGPAVRVRHRPPPLECTSQLSVAFEVNRAFAAPPNYPLKYLLLLEFCEQRFRLLPTARA
jgi:hypothetical protein